MSNFAWNGGGGLFCNNIVFVTKLIDWIVFYAVSAIFQPYNDGVTKLNHKSDHFISPTRSGSRISFFGGSCCRRAVVVIFVVVLV